MAKRKIVWTKKANIERINILEFWIDKNKSNNYSIKLNKLIKDTLITVASSPLIGRKTDFENVRVFIVRDYLIFYEISKTQIKVLSIWDQRRDTKTIEIK